MARTAARPRPARRSPPPAARSGPTTSGRRVAAPEHWRDDADGRAATLANTPWWELFQDPELQELIQIALVENQDLQIAVERIEEARARYGFTSAPTSSRRSISPAQGGARASQPRTALAADPDGRRQQDSALRRRRHALLGARPLRPHPPRHRGRARAAARAPRRRSAPSCSRWSPTSRAPTSSCATSTSSSRSRAARSSRASEYVDLARDRFEGGLTSELDWRQAEAEYHRTAAIVRTSSGSSAQMENAALGAARPQPRRDLARPRRSTSSPCPSAVPAGLPSELLDRRPDVRVAEQNLVAANADIGEAKALLYPRIALTGAFGFASTELDDLFDSPAQSYSVARRPAAADLQRRQEPAAGGDHRVGACGRRSTATSARCCRPSARSRTALVAYRKLGEQRVTQRARVDAERKVLELAELRYRGGVSDYLEVLDAQRSLFDAELDEIGVIGAHQVGARSSSTRRSAAAGPRRRRPPRVNRPSRRRRPRPDHPLSDSRRLAKPGGAPAPPGASAARPGPSGSAPASPTARKPVDFPRRVRSSPR